MKQTIRTYSLMIICGLLVVGCKKYPEGGYEKDGPKNIIGTWQLTLYEVNGIDSTDLINYNGNPNYKSINISKLQTSITTHNARINNSVGIGFNFTDSNKKLDFSSSYGTIYCPTIIPSSDCYKIIFAPEASNLTWEVSKLTSSELIMHANTSNNYTLKMKK